MSGFPFCKQFFHLSLGSTNIHQYLLPFEFLPFRCLPNPSTGVIPCFVTQLFSLKFRRNYLLKIIYYFLSLSRHFTVSMCYLNSTLKKKKNSFALFRMVQYIRPLLFTVLTLSPPPTHGPLLCSLCILPLPSGPTSVSLSPKLFLLPVLTTFLLCLPPPPHLSLSLLNHNLFLHHQLRFTRIKRVISTVQRKTPTPLRRTLTYIFY